MGTPAWQKREYERQEFLEDIYQEFLRDVENEREKRASFISPISAEAVYFRAAGLLLEHIRQMRYLGHLTSDDGGKHLHGPLGYEILAKPLDRIKEFSKTIEEAMVLRVRFMEKILRSALSQFDTFLHTQELEHPELIYGKYGRTEDVPY